MPKYNSDNVAVLLGDGSGSFGSPHSFPAGDNPRSVAIEDYNGDGKLDLAVANFGTDQNLPNFGGNVSVMLEDGTGSFGAPTNYTAADAPTSVTSDDFNGDGSPDLAVANAHSGNVSVLLNKGDGSGSFKDATNIFVGFNAMKVAIDDFNHDGKADLAVVKDAEGAVSVLLGDGQGGFATPSNFPAEAGAKDLAIADLNRDGKLDLAVANFGGTVSVLLGDGTGSFGGPQSFTSGGTGITIADFNGDGNLDLGVAGGSVAVLLGDGSGSFGTPQYFSSNSAVSLVSAEFNGDGKPDIAAQRIKA